MLLDPFGPFDLISIQILTSLTGPVTVYSIGLARFGNSTEERSGTSVALGVGVQGARHPSDDMIP